MWKAHCKGRHFPMLLHSISKAPTSTSQCEYVPNSSKKWYDVIRNFVLLANLALQAPKVTATAAKQALILAWFHKTAVAHSIKDLEKAIPSIASINGMQVKDYLQALSDDNKICVEKIGSGNWYWSFPSDEKKAKEAMLVKAQEEYDKINSVVADLQAKVVDASAAREDDEKMPAGTGIDT
jgi:hypothetical protein